MQNSTKGNHPSIWIVLAWLGVAVGAVLRFVNISKESLWFDEGYTAWMVTHPAREIIRLIQADTAPPLYYLCLHGWTRLWGHSELALRSMSAAASILALVLMIPLARRFVRSPAAVAAVVWALALGFHQQFYAQEARFYATMAFLYVAMLHCLVKHLAAPHRYWLIPLAIAVAASIYTHYMMAPYILTLAPLWLILPSAHSPRKRVLDGILVAIGAFVLFSPWAFISLYKQLHFVHAGFWIEPATAGSLFELMTWLLSVPDNWFWANVLGWIHFYPANPGFWAGIVAATLFAGAVWLSVALQHGSRRRDAIGLLVAVALPPILVILYSAISTPLVMDKVFLGSAAVMPLLLMLPLGMELKPPLRRVVWIGAGIVLFFALGTLTSDMFAEKKEDWRGAARFVAQLPPRHRLIVFLADDGQLPFDYYFGAYPPGEDATGAPAGFFDRDPPRAMLRVLQPQDLQHLQSVIDAGHYEQIVFVESHQQWNDPLNLTLKYLLVRFPDQDRVDLYDVSVWWFEAKRPQ